MSVKKTIWFIIGLITAYAGVKAVMFFSLETDKINPVYLVPDDVIFFMEMDEPVANLETLSKSEIWDHLQTNTTIRKLSSKVNSLDSIFQNQTGLFELIGDRDLIISAHMIKRNDYGFLYIIDMDKLSQLELIKNNINQVITQDYNVTKRTYLDTEITEIRDNKTFETISLAYLQNQLIASYTPKLVEKSINAHTNPVIGTDIQFLELQQELKKKGLFRLYFNHKQLVNYYRVFSNEKSDAINILQENGNYSGFIIDEDDDRLLTATGFTAGTPILQSLAMALDQSGTGSVDATTILPEHTAFYFSLGFDDFSVFHDSFYGFLSEKNQGLVTTYNNEKKKLEDFLDINLEDDFYNWVDDEIAFAKANHKELHAQEGIAALFKTKEVDLSAEKLTFIKNQIRKKTPVKFQDVVYKDHTISYLDIKGFFKLILGSLYEQLEKPYFTTIDQYVVFSNSPKTLKIFIDDYLSKKSLLTNEYYREFIDEFSNSSNLFIYVNTNELASVGKSFLNPATRQLLEQQESFYSQFTQIGFELKALDDIFKTRAILHYDSSYDIEALRLEHRTRDLPMNLVKINKEEFDKETIFNIDLFPSDFTASDYQENHVNGNTRFKVPLKDGLPHGRYKEYYISGDLKISGRFRNGKKTGTWKYFTREGKLYYKRRF